MATSTLFRSTGEMAKLRFTDNGVMAVPFGAVPAQSSFHGRDFLVSWDGVAAGGKLRVYSSIHGLTTPVPDTNATIGELDGDGNERKQMRFWTKGELLVELSGAGGGILLDVAVM